MLFLLTSLALAAEASWCIASWDAPASSCAIDGRMTASAAGVNEDAAADAARRRLGRVAQLAANDLVGYRELRADDLAGCAETVPDEAEVSCQPVESPVDGDYCFVTFDDAGCWDGTVLTVSRGGWQAVVIGRERMCNAVDARLARLRYTNSDERRKECSARCAAEAVVSCPPVR